MDFLLKLPYRALLSVFICTSTLHCNAEEFFEEELEALALQNIKQLTFPSMNFEKAGEAYFSQDEKSIIFQAVPIGEEHYQIYTLQLDENVPVMVSSGVGACTCSNFSPDGKKIIFASSHESPSIKSKGHQDVFLNQEPKNEKYKWDLTPYMNIYEANLDGSCLVPLTSGAAYHAECAYSPDGSQIVYASNEDGSMNIYKMKADGSDVQQITFTNNCYNGGPFFSPNGQQIIFRADRERRDYLQIYVIDADGTNERQLTFNEAVNWAPYWHPNGKVIAFTTSLHGHRQYEIYLLNIESGIFYRLTHNASFNGIPVFSHDGKKILWTSKRGFDKTCQIFIADFNMPLELN